MVLLTATVAESIQHHSAGRKSHAAECGSTNLDPLSTNEPDTFISTLIAMVSIVGRCLVTFSYGARIVAAVLWSVMWSGAVERAYTATPTGSHELWFAIQFDVGGALFVGLVLYWLLRKIANQLLDISSPDVSPIDVIRLTISTLMPDRPNDTHLSPINIGIKMVAEEVGYLLGSVAKRLNRVSKYLFG